MRIVFTQPSNQRCLPRHSLIVGLLCALLLVGTASAQAATPNSQAAPAGQGALATYSDSYVSFLYPKTWFVQAVASTKGVVIVGNDQTAVTSATTPQLTKDQVLIEIVAGPDASQQISALSKSGSALDVLNALIKSIPGNNTTFGTPEAVHLINAADAAQVTAHDPKSNDEGLVILLSPTDHPVVVTGITSHNQLAENQLLIQGIASTIQTNSVPDISATVSPTEVATAAAVSLSETFTNKVYTLNYPSGWLTSFSPSYPAQVYLSTDQTLMKAANSGKFSLTSGQILVGLISGADAYKLAGASPSTPPSPSDFLTGLNAQLVDSSSGIFRTIAKPTSITIGTQPGAEAVVTLKNGGGSGYVIAFYQNKNPILMLGFTALGESETNRALFEQLAASITLKTP